MSNFDMREWIAPKQAAEIMSKRAGYQITVDDIRQLRRLKRIKKLYKLSDRITLYNLEEIRKVTPPKKRRPVPVEQDKNAA